jgi:ferredoxin
MFKSGDIVRVTMDGPYVGREFIVSSDRHPLPEFTNVSASGVANFFSQLVFLTAALELVTPETVDTVVVYVWDLKSPTSIRCEYCAGCDHCTVECPGLRHDIEPVRAFRERHGLTPKPRNCTVCGEPEWSGRRIVGMGGSCGDCLSGGTPLTAQPIPEPERIKYHAGQTPAWDWVGDT